MSDYQRIERIKEVYNFRSDRSLALDIGINVQIFYDIKAEKCKISHELAEKIQDKFKNINRRWLLTGDGDMLRTEQKSENNSGVSNVSGSDIKIKNEVGADTNISELIKEMAEQRKAYMSLTDKLLSMLENK